jgi:hypothetical protein
MILMLDDLEALEMATAVRAESRTKMAVERSLPFDEPSWMV